LAGSAICGRLPAACRVSGAKEEAMGRSILGVVVGYVLLFIILFCVLTAAYLGIGAERAFLPGSFRPSTLWNVIEVVVGFGAAMAAGWVCLAIARKRGAVTALIVVILVIGAVSAIPVVSAASAPEAVRDGSLTNMQAMMKARPAVWMTILNPILGAVGALVGSRLKRD
jgi:uncharacterized membrane protein YeaQ/YmgE (transglycosylase-associated protein family)